MSPRERLLAALRRADFKKAHEAANVILETAPVDPFANFAVGMDFFVLQQYTQAQVYAKKKDLIDQIEKSRAK